MFGPCQSFIWTCFFYSVFFPMICSAFFLWPAGCLRTSPPPPDGEFCSLKQVAKIQETFFLLPGKPLCMIGGIRWTWSCGSLGYSDLYPCSNGLVPTPLFLIASFGLRWRNLSETFPGLRQDAFVKIHPSKCVLAMSSQALPERCSGIPRSILQTL